MADIRAVSAKISFYKKGILMLQAGQKFPPFSLPNQDGRTVKLSPLTILLAVLVGAALAGVLGALGAIPVAGAIQVVIADWRRARIVQARPVDLPPETAA